MLLKLALLLFWPILQGSPQYVELSKFWNKAATIETGFKHPLAVLTCPSKDSTTAGWLVAADSSGTLLEFRFDGASWNKVRTFPAGTPLTCIASAATHNDMEYRLYAGTKTGQIIELSRGTVGWSKRDIIQLPGPVKMIFASEAGGGGALSALFAIDGNGKTSELVPPADDAANPSAHGAGRWSARPLPDIPGGASRIIAHNYGARLWAAAAGPTGDVYRYDRDSSGQWHGDSWAKMDAGVKYLAPSADPSARDIAVFYYGTDGLFRFLFKGYTDDKKARIPLANGITGLIGVGNQRRFNEFFAVSGDEFCMFEFSFEDKAWHKVSISKIDLPVVSATFGFGLNDISAQMYLLSSNGKIQQFVRYKN